MNVLNAGYQYRCEYGFDLNRPNGNGLCLFVLFKSPVSALSGGVMTNAEPYASILYAPGSRQRYYARQGLMLHDFVEFALEGAEDESFLRELPRDVLLPPALGKTLEKWTELIAGELFSGAAEKSEVMRCLTNVLLLRLRAHRLSVGGGGPSDERVLRYADSLRSVRMAVYSNPQLPWRVRDMAEMVPLSESYMKALYQSAFGVSCMRDVIAARVAMAKRLLMKTGESVERVGEMCGYASCAHFSRQFRDLAGQSPSAYRAGRKKGPPDASLSNTDDAD